MCQGNVLFPTNLVGDLHKDNTNVTVMDILCQKYPAAQTPKASALVVCDTLPLLEDVVEITGSHILFVAHRVQGGAEPGNCDAGHWRDVLLCFSAHSSILRDAVAILAHRLLNGIVPWVNITALVAKQLIALNKYPGVCPIGIRETL